MARRSGKTAFLPFVIHPQSGGICDALRDQGIMDEWSWPPQGFAVPRGEDVLIWPVPRLREARIVDCGRCRRTGIQPQTWEAVARYIPGAVLVEKDGYVSVHLPSALAQPLAYPTGSGEDEVDP